MLSGFFFAFAVLKYGVTQWREKFINTGDSDIHIGAWWDWAIRLVIVESVVLMGWWLYQAQGGSFAETWTLFSSFNVGSVLIQWAIALVALYLLNGWLVAKLPGAALGTEAGAGGSESVGGSPEVGDGGPEVG
jgi:NSS family neurotransmitter:Na+ symporter